MTAMIVVEQQPFELGVASAAERQPLVGQPVALVLVLALAAAVDV